MVHLTIDGTRVQAKEGEMLLKVIKQLGIDVPSLCDHDAVEPFGACRLCLVEITKQSWDGWKKYVTSCLYPVEDGLIVNTQAEKVVEARKTLIDLQLARCPGSPEIQQLAADYGITQTSYEPKIDSDNCILCGLCTRICEHMGFAAISTVDRGPDRRIASPLDEPPPDCIGCLACAINCPTNVIPYTEKGNKRTIWDKEFELITCSKCGRKTITRDFARALSKMRDIPEAYFEVCDACHRAETATNMGRIAGWSRREEAAS
ncbi:2Fe-2S iron-sulfur cluster binding domain-containing protein [candidate division GN15 bacterium]|nr:2Fe-2S iron-sulfur cluster binding domain-containing protein [candidate division GN15 bacterium]